MKLVEKNGDLLTLLTKQSFVTIVAFADGRQVFVVCTKIHTLSELTVALR